MQALAAAYSSNPGMTGSVTGKRPSPTRAMSQPLLKIRSLGLAGSSTAGSAGVADGNSNGSLRPASPNDLSGQLVLRSLMESQAWDDAEKATLVCWQTWLCSSPKENRANKQLCHPFSLHRLTHVPALISSASFAMQARAPTPELSGRNRPLSRGKCSPSFSRLLIKQYSSSTIADVQARCSRPSQESSTGLSIWKPVPNKHWHASYRPHRHFWHGRPWSRTCVATGLRCWVLCSKQETFLCWHRGQQLGGASN